MITQLDDYCVHQTPDYVAIPSTTDRNFYDRYYFIGYERSGKFMFGVAFGKYPNRFVKDAHFTFTDGVRQVSLHASVRVNQPDDKSIVGPMGVHILRPMVEIRCESTQCNGVAYELRFTAVTGAIDEGRLCVKKGGITTIDQTRFMQYGRWSGWISIDGERYELKLGDVYGLRDKSWGVRLIAERHATLHKGGQIFWMNVVMKLRDGFSVIRTLDDEHGHSHERKGYIAPVYGSVDELPIEERHFINDVSSWTFELQCQPGTRRIVAGSYVLSLDGGGTRTISAKASNTLWYAGLGYNHQKWNHGLDHGPGIDLEREDWVVSDIDLRDPDRQFMCSSLTLFENGEMAGFGHTEHLLIGAYAPLSWSPSYGVNS